MLYIRGWNHSLVKFVKLHFHKGETSRDIKMQFIISSSYSHVWPVLSLLLINAIWKYTSPQHTRDWNHFAVTFVRRSFPERQTSKHMLRQYILTCLNSRHFPVVLHKLPQMPQMPLMSQRQVPILTSMRIDLTIELNECLWNIAVHCFRYKILLWSC